MQQDIPYIIFRFSWEKYSALDSEYTMHTNILLSSEVDLPDILFGYTEIGNKTVVL